MAEVKTRNTVQKDVIARIVKDACDHPTAEMIYDKVKQELPNVSLGTVYRVLKDLADKGEIIEIPLANAPSRFDKTVMLHAHLVCETCGRVLDVMLKDNLLNNESIKSQGFKVNRAELIYRGLCSDCNVV